MIEKEEKVTCEGTIELYLITSRPSYVDCYTKKSLLGHLELMVEFAGVFDSAFEELR